jgi:hypothetical protein
VEPGTVPPLPGDVSRLLYEHVHTYEQLEALLKLQSGGEAEWTDGAVADALRVTVDSAGETLRGLALAGIAERVGQSGQSARYRLCGGEIAAVVARLARAYQENPLDVIRTMNANAIQRMRTDAIRAFADAFIFHRGSRNG